MEHLTGAGVHPGKILIDVEGLVGWCKSNNRPVDGQSRAEFISRKTREKFSR